MSTLIMKFGGNALGTVTALSQVLSIILHEKQRWKNLVIVASALDGVTDNLLEAAHLAQVSNQRGYRRITATLRTRHLALVDQLPLGAQERTSLQADIDHLLFEMLDECQHVADIPSDSLQPEVSDRIIGVGERLAARIIAALLRQNNLRGVAIDGTDLIVTNTIHGNARADVEQTQAKINENLAPMMSRDIVPVITGFIGRSTAGKPTTLGRGGSDYTSSLLAVCTNAREVWVWSDVDGMMTTDPREVDGARVIGELSYAEVAELAYFGARILHPRMIYPLRDRQIPLRIKNVYKPQAVGTLIHQREGDRQDVQAVTYIPGIGLQADRSGSVAHITQIVDDVLFETIGTRADVTISSQSSSQSFLAFVIPTSAGGAENVEAIRVRLSNRLHAISDDVDWHIRPVSIISAIGDGIGKRLDIFADILQHLEGITVLGMAQGPSGCSLSVIIDPDHIEATLHRIHDMIVNTG